MAISLRQGATKTSKIITAKSWRKEPTTILRVKFLAREAMAQYTEEFYQTIE
ncbi:hypothetical protein ACLOJK_003544 [Asimina triloba]